MILYTYKECLFKMKKVVLSIAIIATIAFLSACQSDDSETMVETEYGSISQEDLHSELEELYGEETLETMTKKLVLENQYEIDEEEFEEEVQTFKDQLGPQFNQFIQQQGYRNEGEFRNALFISKLEFEAATADIEVTDEEVQQRYDRMQEERQVRHVLVDDKETAEEVIQKYNDGQDFADLAAEYSTDSSAADGGNLGYAGAGQMVEPFEDAMYALEVNEISEPVESQFGWHVILVEDIRETEGETQPFDEMKDQLREQIIASKVDPQSYTERVQAALDNGNIDVKDEDYNHLFNSGNANSEEESGDEAEDSETDDTEESNAEENAEDDAE